MSWKAAIVGPAGAVTDTPAFRLLYQFETREEAEAHAACFRTAGCTMGLVEQKPDVQDKPHGGDPR